MAIIDVLVTKQGVAARANRESEDHGHDVTWLFTPSLDTFQVVFRGFQAIPTGPLQDTSAQGPFSQPLTTRGGRVTGTVHPNTQNGLYIYDIHDGTTVLNWLTPISDTQNFGGLDVPKGPPPPSPPSPTGSGT